MSPQQQPAPLAAAPVRPVIERVRDYAIVGGVTGGIYGACVAARHEAPILLATACTGGGVAFLAGSFIGLRHALIQGRWEEDNELVSGVTAGALGFVTVSLMSNPRAGARAAALCTLGGSVLHYAHRWWLHARVVKGW